METTEGVGTLDFFNWLKTTKGLLPVAVFHPTAGGYQEGYVNGPVVDDWVEFYPHGTTDVSRLVPKERLAPTARKFTKIDGEAPKIPVRDRAPTEASVLRYIKNIPGQTTFTKDELEAALGRDISQELSQLDQAGIRTCAITGQEQPTYKLRRTSLEILPVQSLWKLNEQLQSCTGCPLGEDRVKRGVPSPCFGRGSQKAKGLIIGEAPGKTEEETGIVFHPTAPAGRVLSRVMLQAGLKQEDWYIDNAVPCRPMPKELDTFAENGKPTAEEILACSPRLKTIVLLIRPKIVVLLGAYAFAAWYGTHPQSLGSLVGWQPDVNPRVYVMYHPAFYVRKARKLSDKARSKLAMEYLEKWKEIAEFMKGA